MCAQNTNKQLLRQNKNGRNKTSTRGDSPTSAFVEIILIVQELGLIQSATMQPQCKDKTTCLLKSRHTVTPNRLCTQ